MSSCVISSRTNTNNENKEFDEPEEILSQGIEKIYHSFNINNKRYKEKISENEIIINGLTKKLENLNNELEMLQRENHYYKMQNEKLKKEVEKLNKIVKKIQGKLSKVDFQINECIKNDNIKNDIKKNELYNKRKKHNSLYMNYKNKDNNQSLFKINSKNFLVEENDKIDNYNNKSAKNKKLVYFIDNNILKDNGNKINYEKEMQKEIANKINNDIEANIKKKTNKTVGHNSFDLNMNINENNLYKKSEKLKSPNSVLCKNIITKEDKKKTNKEFDNDQPRESSLSCQDNNKNITYSYKKFLKENEKNKALNNKTTDEEEISIITNNKILNIDQSSSNNKGYESKICLTSDNLFNKRHSKKKISYTSFRGKILNKNISENIFKSDKHKREKTLNNDIIENSTKSEEITFFLKKCKMLLEKEIFDEILKLFEDYKEGLLTDEGIFIKTQSYLENNNELIELFNNIFGK